MKSPIEVLVVIADTSYYSRIKKILKSFKIDGQIVMYGQGTAKTNLGDIFGFGIMEKDVITTIVDTNKAEEICKTLIDEINAKGENGIVFTMPISAISSDLFQIVKEDKNDQ